LIDPSILKTERPPVTCAPSKSYCGRRNRPTAPPAPPARAGSFIGTFRKWRDVRVEAVMRAKADAPAASRPSQELAASLAVGAAAASAVGETRCIIRSQDSFSTLPLSDSILSKAAFLSHRETRSRSIAIRSKPSSVRTSPPKTSLA
jgi:hypothetical protein